MHEQEQAFSRLAGQTPWWSSRLVRRILQNNLSRQVVASERASEAISPRASSGRCSPARRLQATRAFDSAAGGRWEPPVRAERQVGRERVDGSPAAAEIPPPWTRQPWRSWRSRSRRCAQRSGPRDRTRPSVAGRCAQLPLARATRQDSPNACAAARASARAILQRNTLGDLAQRPIGPVLRQGPRPAVQHTGLQGAAQAQRAAAGRREPPGAPPCAAPPGRHRASACARARVCSWTG